MANEFAPLFSLPSLEEYQRAQKAQDSEGMNVLQRRSMDSSYDFARQMGYKTPEERKVMAGQKVIADAETAETETADPLTRQFNVLNRAAASFGKLGMYDYVQKIAPELARLRNQMLEQAKLMADADKTRVDTIGKKLDNTVAFNTLDARIAQAQAESEAAGLDEETWVNQKTADIQSVNAKSKADTAKWKALGYTKYVPGIGADKRDLAAKTQSTLDTTIIDSETQLSQLQEIAHTFRPEYLQVGTQVKNWALGVKDWINGVTPEEAAQLSSYADFRRTAANAFNRYIKYITGAQMSQTEADRIQKGFLNAEKDGPTAFKAKLRSTAKEILGIRERARRYIEQGGVIPKNPDGTFNGEMWDKIQIPPVSDEDVNKFLGEMAGEGGSTLSDEDIQAKYRRGR